MPIYVFRCQTCRSQHDELRQLGETTPGPCPDCGGPTKLRFGRVAVKYQSFGFSTTDRLVSDPTGKDFRALREKAEQIADD